MGSTYKNVIFTDHAEARMSLRRISKSMIAQTIQQPDSKEKESDGDTKFSKTINKRKVQVVAYYLPDEKKWLVKSTWVRGEDDPQPLLQRLLSGIFRIIRGLFKR